MREGADSSNLFCTQHYKKMHSWKAVLLFVVVAFVSASFAERRPLRLCPDGQYGTNVCNGRNPKSCSLGFYCYAPTDVGFCCRSTPPIGDGCPPPPGCGGYVASRGCVSGRRCPGSQVCCPDGCGNTMCMDPIYK